MQIVKDRADKPVEKDKPLKKPRKKRDNSNHPPGYISYEERKSNDLYIGF